MGEIIRVAHVIGIIAKGGVESVVFNYYRFIDKTKIQFDFIVDKDSPCEIPSDILELGCRVYKIPSYKNLFTYIKKLKQIFTDGNYKIVHSHMNTLSIFALFAAKKSNVPVRIAHSHSTAGKGEFFRNIMKYSLRPFSRLFPTHFLACSEYAGRWLFGNTLFDSGRCKVIINAVDVSKFVYKEEVRQKVREELHISNKFVLGHIGRFMQQKNHDFLIDIFKEIHKRNANSVLLLVGDGELKEKIEIKVAKIGLRDSVIFLGVRSDVHEIYQAMDVFVFPSLYEGLGMAAIESQIAGVCTVVSDKVPHEAKISENFHSIKLNDSVELWADNILYKSENMDRGIKNTLSAFKYSIEKEVTKLHKFYLKCNLH